MPRILSIDPSGTGTSGICLVANEDIEFQEIKNPFWERHLVGITELAKEWEAEIITYEYLKFIKNFGNDMFHLFKLIGAIEGLKYFLPLQIDSVPVDQVKRLRRKIASGKKTIEPLIYKKYTGWLYNGKKISEHQVDAFLVYYLFACKMAKI